MVIDDGSTDGTGKVAEQLAAGDSRIKLLSHPHQGIVSALNCGLENAESNIIARMDADDVCDPERLEKQLSYLQAYPGVDVVSCQVEFGGDRRRQAGYAAHVDWTNRILTQEQHFANRFVDAPVAHPSVMWRREVSDKFGSYREGAFPEDFDLWLRWMEQGVRFEKIPEVLMRWNDSPGRLSRVDSRYAPDAFYDVKCRYLKTALPSGRPVWLWGAGRITRKRFVRLEPFTGYIDVDSKKADQTVDGKPVILPREIPAEAFVISGVAARGGRGQIENFLQKSGRQAVQDYLLCA